MKRLFYSAVTLCLFALAAQAQDPTAAGSGKKGKTLVSDEYDRNAVSVITLTHGDSYDRNTVAATEALPSKYDNNLLSPRTINVGKGRDGFVNDQDAEKLLKDAAVAKAIACYIFNRQSDGTMDDALLQRRSRYNVTDQEVISARASAVGEGNLLFQYDKLINSTYVMLFDAAGFDSKTSTDKKGNKTTTYYAKAFANVYKLNFDLDAVYAAWIYDTDTPEVKAQKNKAFDEIAFTLDKVTAVANVSGSSSDGYTEAVASAFSSCIDKLEKQIPTWQVRVSVYSIKPITAKVGRKESVSNGTRYRAYVTKEDKNGNVFSEKRGYVRATEVVDNRQDAQGNSEPSKFAQISGGLNIQEGWLLKESKDAKIGVALLPLVGHLGSSMNLHADIDYLASISTNGHQIHGILSLGINGLDGLLSSKGKASTYAGSIGAGYQILFAKRKLVLEPYAHVGMDFVKESKFKDYGLFVGGGLKFGVQFYPVQIFVTGGYDAIVKRTAYYYGTGFRNSAPFFGAGVRFEL